MAIAHQSDALEAPQCLRAGAFYASFLTQCDRDSTNQGSSVVLPVPITQNPSTRERIVSGASASTSEILPNNQSLQGEAKAWDGKGIGYQLLRRAGYKGSGGLGAREQGVAVPLEAWNQPGKEGIGHAQGSKATSYTKADSKTSGTVEGTTLRGSGLQLRETARQEARQKKLQKGLKRRWPTVGVEEDLDQKVKRWNWILQAEADEKAGKQLDQYIFRQFKDDSLWDTNPLTRRNNLSSTNPLL